jgi:hypothetical protein
MAYVMGKVITQILMVYNMKEIGKMGSNTAKGR